MGEFLLGCFTVAIAGSIAAIFIGGAYVVWRELLKSYPWKRKV